MNTYKNLDPTIKRRLMAGVVIPAHPLALNEDLTLNEKRQRLLTRYYIASGAGGVAVGVHTTQFNIRKPEINLLESVLSIAAEEVNKATSDGPFIKVAGICGPTAQAIQEAELAVKYGYHLGLLSNGGLESYTEADLIERAKAIAAVIPLFGFYLQPAVGGRFLSFEFWQELVKIPNVDAIKIAAFNRYQTLDVVRAVCESDRVNEIALYTGNDDNIVADLLTPYQFTIHGQQVEKRFVGGLLGHWAMWTSTAKKLLDEVQYCISHQYQGVEDLLIKGNHVTDMNAAIFDAKNQYHGCIPGIHEVLYRQGLLDGRWCLDPTEQLSVGQMKEIDRIIKSYPLLQDKEFVNRFLQMDKFKN